MNKSLATNLIAISLMSAGHLSPLYSTEIRTMGLFSFSGAITNWLAIHMLFEKVPFLYGSGIVTERFQEFKMGISDLIMNQFFTEENFQKSMTQNSTSMSIDGDAIVGTLDFEKIFSKLKAAILESPFGGMLGMIGGEKALEPLKPAFEVKFKEAILEMVNDESFLSNITSGSSFSLEDSVKEIVNERLDELTPQLVKQIIQDMIRQHLGWLVVWGGAFGALIGLGTTLL
jgi:uncharacterized membrane protein YheB (UPF0754 family)